MQLGKVNERYISRKNSQKTTHGTDYDVPTYTYIFSTREKASEFVEHIVNTKYRGKPRENNPQICEVNMDPNFNVIE